jgi:uncharacterized protein GlcG (DUF336 family)
MWAALSSVMIGAAFAQAPPPSPEAGSPIDYGFPPRDFKRDEPSPRGPPTNLALEAVLTAIDTCGAMGFKVTAAVFDSALHPVALLTANGALSISPEAATRKAFVTLRTKQSSGAAAERVKSDPAFARELAATGKALPVKGALPIQVGADIIGAISVSGAPRPGDVDEKCARAGLDKIASRLK